MGIDSAKCIHIEAEKLCLGACLINPSVIDDVSERVSVEDFFRDSHQNAFRCLLSMNERGMPIDGGSFADEMAKFGGYDAFGGDDYLAGLRDAVPHSANAKYHAEVVRHYGLSRRTIEVCEDIINEFNKGEMTSSDVLCMAEERILAISETMSMANVVEMPELINESLAKIKMRKDGAFIGLALGFPDVDRLLLGAQPGQLIIVAARPSIGKTAFAVNIAHRVASQAKHVLFMSLEQSRAEIGDRLLSSLTLIPAEALKLPRQLLSREQELCLHKHVDAIMRLPIYIDDTPGRSVGQIGSVARRIKRKKGLDLLIIDHLGKIREPRAKNDQRYEIVGRISDGLKTLAKRLHVPVICLHHINRESDKAGDGRPKIHMLRESGNIEQDADIVMLLHRPEHYNPSDQPGLAELEIAKNRDGQTGTIGLAYVKECVRFDTISREREEPQRRPSDEQPF